MVTINPRSERVNSAENILKKSISHFFLLVFNFPSEAADCIQQLHNALELLVKEWFSLEEREDSETFTSYELFREFWDWDETQKYIAHWLRKKRNALLHSGEAHWEEASTVRKRLLEVYRLTGQTYESLGYKLGEVFTGGEQSILRGKEAHWKDETLILANMSFQFYKDDPELAIQISNGALEKAVRGLATSWRIEGAESMPIPDVVQAMYDNEYEFIADIPIYYEDYQSKPYFFERETHGYCSLRCDCIINTHEILDRVKPYRQDEAIKKALDDNWDVVISFIKNAPYLDYFECVVINWNRIINEFKTRALGLPFPLLNEEHGIRSWWDEDKAICIYFKVLREDVNWEKNHDELLLKIVENVCGEKPDDLTFEINWGDTMIYRNDSILDE